MPTSASLGGASVADICRPAKRCAGSAGGGAGGLDLESGGPIGRARGVERGIGGRRVGNVLAHGLVGSLR
jgi:hypothetical protein